MKKIILILIFVLSNSSSVSSHVLIDSVEYSIDPKSIDMASQNSIVSVSIINNGSDTLVIITDMFIQGGPFKQTIIHPIGKYSPNFISLKSGAYDYFLVDGFFDFNYYEFPQMIVIPPKTRKVMRVDIGTYLKPNTCYFDLGGYLKFAKKQNLDAIVGEYYQDRRIEYENAFTATGSIITTVYPIEMLNSVYKDNNKSNLKRYQDAFE